MITRDERGAFHWRGTVDKSYEHKAFRIVFGVTGGICAFYIIASLALGGDMLGVALLCSAAALAVAGVVCWLFDRRAGRRTQGYIMTEDAVMFCQGRSNPAVTFGSVRKAVVYPSRNMIELYQPLGSAAVFAPREDFEFVKGFILQRLPASAQVIQEQ